MTESAVLQILRWAAGAGEDVSGIEEVAPERLLDLLDAHNLVSRFHHRCQQEKPRWYTRALSIPCYTKARAIEGRTRHQIAAVQEISEALPPEALPLIVIKGPAVFAITGERRHFRLSGDLDLLCADSQHLWETLISLGFRGERDDALDETKSSAHEFGVLTRGGTTIEIHNYFPVVRYPDEVRRADLLPVHHPDQWVQTLPVMLQSQIGFDLLSAHSMNGIEQGTRHMRVPDPAASILILCAHEFRNFLHSPFTGMTVRLSALADVYDLARDPRFNSGCFLTLMEETGAKDSVCFVASLLQAYYGRQPLPLAVSSFEGSCFPQSLSYSGGWASLSNPDDLLLMSGSEVSVPALGANQVIAAKHGGKANLPRLILKSPMVPRIELGTSCDESGLHLRVEFLDALPEGYEYEIYLHSRYQSSGADAWKWEFISSDEIDDPASLTRELSFQWAALPESFRQAKRIPMMLVVARFQRAEWRAAGWFSWNSKEPLAVIPLEIFCEL